jgi:hypothetical protein
MVYLDFNTANQTRYFTLDEGRLYYATPFTHYLLVMIKDGVSVGMEGERLAQVLNVISENTRSTEVTLTTIGLQVAGYYRYFVYGQNSAVNLDENNAAVVGLVEQGLVNIGDNTNYFTPTGSQIDIVIIP